MWTQALICLLFWLAFGGWLKSRSETINRTVAALPRSNRVLVGTVGIFASAGILLGGLWFVGMMGGVQHGLLTPWAWMLTILLGLVFVGGQSVSASALVSLALDRRADGRAEASKETEGL